MSALSSVYPNNFESVKAAKEAFVNSYVNNHPNRLSVLRLTGTLDIEFDGRNSELVTGLNTEKITDAWDFADLPVWTRRFNEKLPIIFNTELETGEFEVSQNIYYFWRFGIIFGADPDPVVVGEKTTTYYERDTVDDPWEETSTETSDLEATWTPYIGGFLNPSLNRGGDPTSGGRGADSDENSVLFATWPDIYGGALLDGVEVYRLPWDINWANESEAFSDAVTDYIAARNLADEGGWTGSTTLALEFT